MKDIKGYEDRYAVDEDGSVWSKNYNKTGKMKKMKGGINRYGYPYVIIRKDGKQKGKTVHRLVAQAYLPDYCEELSVDHIDRDKTNNNLSNLRMVTHQKNTFNTKAKGYTWHKTRQKWMAFIGKDGKQHYLGLFTTEEEAHQAYLDAKEIYHKM